jgi:hypothetical protein
VVGGNQVNVVTFVSESGVTYYILVRPAVFEFANVLDLSIVNASPATPVVSPVAPKAPQAPFATPAAPVLTAPVRTPTKLPIFVPPPTKAPMVRPTKVPNVPPTKSPIVPPTKAPSVQPTKKAHSPANPAYSGTPSSGGSRGPDDFWKVPFVLSRAQMAQE